MNLPASIEGSGSGELPTALREKARRVRQEGGPQSIAELFEMLNSLGAVSPPKHVLRLMPITQE